MGTLYAELSLSLCADKSQIGVEGYIISNSGSFNEIELK
jgi:hypothetical protein